MNEIDSLIMLAIYRSFETIVKLLRNKTTYFVKN